MVSFVLVVNGGVIMRPIDADALNKKLQERVGSPESDELYEVNLCIIERLHWMLCQWCMGGGSEKDTISRNTNM